MLNPSSSEQRPLYLQMTHVYAPAWGYGGPVRLMLDYARLMGQAFRVMVLSGDLHHDFTRIPQKFDDQDGVTVERFRVHLPRLARKSIYLISPRMWIRAASLLRCSGHSTIVHVAELRGLIPLYALLLKLLFGERVLLVHSAFGMLHTKPGWRRKAHDLIFMKAFQRSVDLRLTQNDHEFAAYQTFSRAYGCIGQGGIALLPLHVDARPLEGKHFGPRGKKEESVRELRKKYGIPEDALVFMFLGRLHADKGVLRTIEAFLEFSKLSQQRTLLLIIGRDDGFQGQIDRFIVEREAGKRIHVINNVYSDRFEYYFLSDVFLGFPTIFEETMLASVEALTCGTPIIVSREADIPFVEREGAGRVLDFDVRAVVATMVAFVDDLPRLQLRAREVAIRYFCGSKAGYRLLDLFQKAQVERIRRGAAHGEHMGKSSGKLFGVDIGK